MGVLRRMGAFEILWCINLNRKGVVSLIFCKWWLNNWKSTVVPFIFHTRGAKSWLVHQRPVVLDSLLEGGSSADTAFSLANQCSTLPSHAITTTQANIPHDGLLRPPRTPYGLLWSLKGTVERHTHIHTHPSEEIGFSAGEAPLTVHQAQGDMGEVRAWQIQGIIRPLSSLQLSLTRLVGENEGERREFMTYPCNHRGALGQLEINHMGR